MRATLFLSIAMATGFVAATPVLLEERAAAATTSLKSTTSSKKATVTSTQKVTTTSKQAAANAATTAPSPTFQAAYPYTASVCAVKPVATPSPAFHCNSIGNLTNPSVIVGDIVIDSYLGCADLCQAGQACISFAYNSKTSTCTLFDLPLTNMGLKLNAASDFQMANRHCFECNGNVATTIQFTIEPTSTATPTPTSKISSKESSPTSSTGTSKATSKASSTTSSKTSSKVTTTSATPTTTITAGAVNIVSNGNFTNQNLGGFQVSLNSAKGGFQSIGQNYAYCCTSQLLGLDSVCVLSQTLDTTIGGQYNVDFKYKFVNRLPGLSTITAPLQGGLIQEVLGLSGTYQQYSSRYFSLTTESLFAIAMNVPLGGNAVCLTDIKVSAI